MMKIGVIVEMLRQPLRDGIRTAAEIGCQAEDGKDYLICYTINEKPEVKRLGIFVYRKLNYFAS